MNNDPVIRHTKISKYQIKSILGEGGMGIVYLAVDTEQSAEVALKVLLRHSIQNPEIKTRFIREARAGKAMNHANIVKIYEVGEEAGELFIAMEYVNGKTIRSILRDKPISAEQVIDISIAVCKALNEAHGQKIIHRDIKSDNIMIDANGEIKVMDFGLAKIQDASVLTRETSVLGTLSYMSPQQAIGEPLDSRSDIFSLGVVMYEMLTGRLPFEGEYEMAVIYSILNEEPRSLSEINEQIPTVLEQIVFKALKKNPAQRYQSAGEMLHDLEEIKQLIENTVEPNSLAGVNLIAAEQLLTDEERSFNASLTGRENQFELLKSILKSACFGEGKTVMITGEAGIGKTRLMYELEKHGKTLKARTIKGKCHLSLNSYPYQPFADALKSYFESKGVINSSTLDKYIYERAPELNSFNNVLKVFFNYEFNSTAGIESKELLWNIIFILLKKIAAEHPLIIFIDDMHWADEDTLNLFYYLARNISSLRVLLAASSRPEDLTPADNEINPLKLILYELNRENLITSIQLSRLGQDDIKNITQSIFRSSDFEESFIELLQKETDGNPFFVIELLKLLQAENIIYASDDTYLLRNDYGQFPIPSKVNDLVLRRIDKLSSEDREILEAASVEGESFHSAMLMECLNINKIILLKKLQKLERENHIIHPADKKYRFDHVKIRDALYTQLNPELRSEYHLMIADYFEKYFSTDQTIIPEIADHYLKAGEELKAVPYVVSAADHARLIFSNNQAIKYYEKSLELLQKFSNEIEGAEEKKAAAVEGLADVFRLTGKLKLALQNYQSLDVDNPDKLKHAELLRKIGTVFIGIGDFENALINLEKARSEVNSYLEENSDQQKIDDEISPNIILGKIKISIANVFKTGGSYEAAINEIRGGLVLIGDYGNFKARSQAANDLGNIYYDLGDYKTAEEMYNQSLMFREKIADKKGIAEVYNNLSNIYYEQGNYSQSAEMMQRSLLLMNEIGFRMGIAGALNNLGTIYQEQGRYKESYDLHKQSLTLREEAGSIPGILLSKANLGSVCIDLNLFDEANSLLDECLQLMLKTNHKVYESQVRAWLSTALAELSQFEKSEVMAESAVQCARQLNQKSTEAAALRTLSTILIKKYEHELFVPDKKNEEIFNQLNESLKIFTSLRMEHEAGRCLYELARYFKLVKKYSDAGKYISEAKKVFIKLGAEGDLKKTDEFILSTTPDKYESLR